MHALERTEQSSVLWSGPHDWEPGRPLGADHIRQPAEMLAEDVAVPKDQRTERLMWRRGPHLPVPRERRAKLCELILAQFQRMALGMKQDQPPDPADLGLLCPYVVVPHSNGLLDLVEQCRRVPPGSASHPGTSLE